MATVRMVKNGNYADIYDSPDTIRQAEKDGYSLVKETKEEKKEVAESVKEETKEDTEKKTVTRGRNNNRK